MVCFFFENRIIEASIGRPLPRLRAAMFNGRRDHFFTILVDTWSVVEKKDWVI